MCNSLIDNKEDLHSKTIYGLEKEILQTVKPNIWNIYTEGNMEQKIEVAFKLYAISVVDYLGSNLETMSVFDFYTSVKYLKNKFKK